MLLCCRRLIVNEVKTIRVEELAGELPMHSGVCRANYSAGVRVPRSQNMRVEPFSREGMRKFTMTIISTEAARRFVATSGLGWVLIVVGVAIGIGVGNQIGAAKAVDESCPGSSELVALSCGLDSSALCL